MDLISQSILGKNEATEFYLLKCHPLWGILSERAIETFKVARVPAKLTKQLYYLTKVTVLIYLNGTSYQLFFDLSEIDINRSYSHLFITF